MLNALHLHRAARLLDRARLPLAPGVLRQLARILFGTCIGAGAEIGPGTRLAFGGMGVVIHDAARLGRGVVLGPNVVIGGRSGSERAPIVDDEVKIGAGACVLGDVRVGRGATIGANSVVIEDVPPGATVVGIPARRIDSEPEAMRRLQMSAESAWRRA